MTWNFTPIGRIDFPNVSAAILQPLWPRTSTSFSYSATTRVQYLYVQFRLQFQNPPYTSLNKYFEKSGITETYYIGPEIGNGNTLWCKYHDRMHGKKFTL